MKTLPALLAAISLLALIAGCGRREEKSSPEHHHVAPHGGTLVPLGDHEFNLEFVLDAATGTLTAYVLDGHAANFVRIPATSFQVAAKRADGEDTLEFKATANPATGETVGNTAQFAAQADWLKTSGVFDGVLKELAIRSKSYASIAFKFPK